MLSDEAAPPFLWNHPDLLFTSVRRNEYRREQALVHAPARAVVFNQRQYQSGEKAAIVGRGRELHGAIQLAAEIVVRAVHSLHKSGPNTSHISLYDRHFNDKTRSIIAKMVPNR